MPSVFIYKEVRLQVLCDSPEMKKWLCSLSGSNLKHLVRAGACLVFSLYFGNILRETNGFIILQREVMGWRPRVCKLGSPLLLKLVPTSQTFLCPCLLLLLQGF